jgi:hypothetical protein
MHRTVRRFPNLFVPGAARSGTTTLHGYLSQHRDIYMAAGKEPHCLCRSDRSIAEYDRIFGEHRAAVYYGDASTMYMILPAVLPTIRAHSESPKFIFVLRNPVDRAWSHYWWARGRTGRESRSFRDAFACDLERTPQLPCDFNNYYFQSGLYSHWLRFYETEFGRQSMIILAFEDLVAQPVATLQGIWRFLELPDTVAIEPQQDNPTALLRFPALFRAHTALGRYGRRMLAGWLPSRLLDRLSRLHARSRSKLVSATSLGGTPSLNEEDRRWVAMQYLRDVRELRAAEVSFRDQWTADFPAA